MERKIRVCTRCVMDETARKITFDELGVCDYCKEFENTAKALTSGESLFRIKSLDSLLEDVKSSGKGKKYDCVVGLSGGVDSSYALVKAVEYGLTPLAVHLDNGWNSELAQNNISELVERLGVDLYTHVIDWQVYRGLMQSFFDADVIDVELLMDHAMLAVNYRQAHKFGVRYILSGQNQATEGMTMPASWNWFKFDRKNIKDIGSLGGSKFDTYPTVGTFRYLYYEHIRKIKWLPFLDYIEYHKGRALEVLTKNYGYKPYLYKHYESVFTRFYQGHLLPSKFDVDKRKLHFSTLILTNQMERTEAVRLLKLSPYGSEQELADDSSYFLKKMNWTQDDLDVYLNREEVPHSSYKSELPLWEFVFMSRASRMLRSVKFW